MANVTLVHDASMDIDALKVELQHIFKELIGASLVNPRDGKNPTHYSHLFENIMSALDDYENLAHQEEEPAYEEPLPKYPSSGLKVIENSQQPDRSKNLKFMAEELLLKVEHLLQKVSEKEHSSRFSKHSS